MLDMALHPHRVLVQMCKMKASLGNCAQTALPAQLVTEVLGMAPVLGVGRSDVPGPGTPPCSRPLCPRLAPWDGST